MSAATEQRAWQRSRPPPAASRNPQLRSANNSPDPSNAPVKPATPASGNVWAKRVEERSKIAGQKTAGATTPKQEGSGAKDVGKKAGESASTAPVRNQAQYNPINGFNQGEVRDFLRAGTKVASYRIANADAPKASGVSENNSQNQMSDGQDFFVQLKKQVAGLKASK